MKKNVFYLSILILGFGSCAKKTQNYAYERRQEENKETLISDAFGTQKESNYSGSARVVKNQGAAVGLDLYLGKVSGVSITGQGASAEIRIRGFTSIKAVTPNPNEFVSDGMNSSMALSEPLFVINGTIHGGRFSDLYTAINVNDIKNVTVLKDASSAGLYGSRGANGVIVINLKKGEE